MLQCVKTDAGNAEFKKLEAELDAGLAIRDGADHGFYAQFNKTDESISAILFMEENTAVGIGAIKPYADKTVEIKRMYVVPSHRGKGIAKNILQELEKWAAEKGFEEAILETGIRQPEAIALYHKCGYNRIENYGQYAGVDTSLCFQKKL